MIACEIHYDISKEGAESGEERSPVCGILAKMASISSQVQMIKHFVCGMHHGSQTRSRQVNIVKIAFSHLLYHMHFRY
jgi:hypothetical protein